ncbi:unnamed protein product [Cladocopium goreaui]|uniref:Uncharacterized protein n=1 Tax=Cladocopium goreaui TaxID=2562237 RepID=A0A9P1CR62_9DINO|nr:unnamed protein product [Cladocopium goreaui]|mmetsp:Transcript_50408/g.80565  ORF Transcript_50408/g.80565 Transcript_50408/m.80565 type:complete len:140 (-) Transcript_50408:24-443(-)
MEDYCGDLVEEMENWLSSDDFDRAWRECYDRACKGSTGRSDRNISETLLLQTAASLHNHLPLGALERMIPAPDAEFVRGALEAVGVEDPRRAGLQDLEHFEAALVVVYTHLAHCASLLESEMPGMAHAILTGKIDPRGA